MIKLSREEAEALFSEAEVINSRIERHASELQIIMQLSNQQYLMLTYNTKSHQKTYFIDPTQTADLVNEL